MIEEYLLRDEAGYRMDDSVNSQILFTRILRHCRCCGKQTPHEARSGPDGTSEVCIRCREDQLMAELDDD